MTFFVPNWCDEHGNTDYPYLIEGELNDLGGIAVTAPHEFVEKCPTVNCHHWQPSPGDTKPRRLTVDEVKAFVANKPDFMRSWATN